MKNASGYIPARQPLLIVISGFAGSGKDAVVDALREQDPSIHFIVTATTRPMRPGEQHGVDYYFYSPEEFQNMIAAGEFIEYAAVYKYLKGVPKKEAARQMSEAFAHGRDVIMRLDVQGSATIRQLYPGAVLIFIYASQEEVTERMRKRDPEGRLPDDFDERMRKIDEESGRIPEFDYVVHNRDGNFDETVRIVKAIMESEHHRAQPRRIQL